MRHTLKWSFFIGTAAAGAVLALLKIFQPIRYEHLVAFGYAFVGASVAAGYVAHRNLEKRNFGKANAVVRTDGGRGFENTGIAVKRIPVSDSGAADVKNAENPESSVPGFVPASMLTEGGAENNISNSGAVVAKSASEEADSRQYYAAEKLLNEIENEEVEEEIRKTGDGIDEDNLRLPTNAGNGFLRYFGRRAKIFTSGGKTISGKFAGMDTHVVLEGAECNSEKKALFLISKLEIARMEIE